MHCLVLFEMTSVLKGVIAEALSVFQGDITALDSVLLNVNKRRYYQVGIAAIKALTI